MRNVTSHKCLFYTSITLNLENIHFQLRVVLNHMTLSTYNGSESLVWLFNQNPRKLNKRSQYESAVNVYNRAYVRKCVLGIEPAEAQLVYDKMEEISGNIRERLNET